MDDLGRSGAKIEALKWSADPVVIARLHLQFEWLRRRLSAPGVVHVTGCTAYGYTMELLRPGLACIDDVMTVLRRDVWADPAEVALDADAHAAYLEERCAHWCPQLAGPMRRWREGLDWQVMTPVATHGDPTVSNMLFRADEPVLIDPIPATPAIPDLREVDEAKVLQSALGYEGALSGAAMLPVADDSWAENVWYWCAVHHVRLLPYMAVADRPAMVDRIRRCLQCS